MSTKIFVGTANRAGNPTGGVELDVVSTDMLTINPVVDEANNYCYTEWRLIASCVLSRTLHAYRMAGGRPVRVPQVGGGASTAAAVRHFLSASRRYITYTVGDTVLLRSML